MELDKIIELIPTYEKLRTEIAKEKPVDTERVTKFLKQYEPEGHDILDISKRPDKIITVQENKEEVTKTVVPTRLPVSYQKLIVRMAATFLCGNPIQLDAMPTNDSQKDILQAMKRLWEKNKLDYDSKTIAKLMMSETEVAEVWYPEKAESDYWADTSFAGSVIKMRMKILANSLGDQLYPVFNTNGDMVAFGREYSIKVEGKDEQHFDLYTDQNTYLGTKKGTEWEVKIEPNVLEKIPVIYYRQYKPEWSDVQWLIDRFEKTISNHSDTNDYFGSPMVFVEGDIEGFASKGESGKVLQGKAGAKASYLSWDQSPKSVELEQGTLRSLIYNLTSTPDISMENMKGLGTFSGFALKMLFMDAHMKAADKEEIFGKSIQRRINLLKAALGKKIKVSSAAGTSLHIKPKFEYYLPKNHQEIVEMLFTATGSKAIMTQETAVRMNPLVTDSQAEIDQLKEEGNVEGIDPGTI